MQVVCPFDKNHQVNQSNLLKHIQKCKSPNRHLYRQCPFDERHWVLHKDFEKHCKSITLKSRMRKIDKKIE